MVYNSLRKAIGNEDIICLAAQYNLAETALEATPRLVMLVAGLATKFNGNLLIAFTVFYISFVATRFWTIICFLHNYYSTQQPRTTVHHQRQVILRISSSPESGLALLLQLLWAWKNPRGPVTMILFPLILVTTCLLSFTIAAQQCYGAKSLSILGCDTFVTAHLPIAKIDTSYECPFKGDICRSADSNIRLDTGFIDSNHHFGVNTQNSERFAYRYVVTRTPLQTEGYTSEYTVINQTWVRYHYGTFTVPDGENQTTVDYIYIASSVEAQYTFPSFAPGSGVVFSQKMDDNWYRGNTDTKTYRPDDAASPMGCVEQWQWCNPAYPRESGCGPLASRNDAISGAAPLFNLSAQDLEVDRLSSNDAQQTNFIWSLFTHKINPVTLPDMLGFLGARSLSSQERLYGGIQWPIPKNQWQLDVTQWLETVFATLQAAYIDTVTGKYALELENTRLGPLNKHERDLCDNHKIRSTAYASFSLFGSYLTFILGGVVISFSSMLQPAQAILHSKFGYRLQLRRLAHEDSDAKKWTRCTGAVPTTSPETNLAQLNITDTTHPILARHNALRCNVTNTRQEACIDCPSKAAVTVQ
ncbi:hypothetical protein F5Y01DRAFT_306503 [Xylaria sp. FL0043]|nr:hypothetical protein F5Y01DRAFT_306503 [Xylaria sp. FL0043]